MRSGYALRCAVDVAEARTSPVIVSFAADKAVEVEGSWRSDYAQWCAVDVAALHTAGHEAVAVVVARLKGEQQS